MHTKSEKLKSGDNLNETLGADYPMYKMIILRIQQKFDVSFSSEEVENLQSIRDMVHKVNIKKCSKKH